MRKLALSGKSCPNHFGEDHELSPGHGSSAAPFVVFGHFLLQLTLPARTASPFAGSRHLWGFFEVLRFHAVISHCERTPGLAVDHRQGRSTMLLGPPQKLAKIFPCWLCLQLSQHRPGCLQGPDLLSSSWVHIDGPRWPPGTPQSRGDAHWKQMNCNCHYGLTNVPLRSFFPKCLNMQITT